ncbi:hypothetical protein ACQPYK_33575 [Streptosporangium sp. CA-135522]|uniref:hypothetical protein n=1 Tax=Streptosporangium sp. CA-135522 TaxID=3240072 RepID=UPI003D89EC65
MRNKNVKSIADALQEAGIVNFGGTIQDLLTVVGAAELDPENPTESGALVWDGYLLIYKGEATGLEELRRLSGPKE